MVSMVDDTLDSLKPHTVIGHSLGGWLAARYSAACGSGQRPTTNQRNYSGPDSVILITPSGVFKDSQARLEWVELMKEARKLGFEGFRPRLFAKEPAWFKMVEPYLVQLLAREDVEQLVQSFREDLELSARLQEIRAQVWIIWGEKDSVLPASFAGMWLQKLQGGKRQDHCGILLSEMGHSPQVEKPAVTAAVLAQIIRNQKPHRYGKRWWKVMPALTGETVFEK